MSQTTEPSVTLDGNTYYLRGDEVHKKHADKTKIVTNPEKVAVVKAAFAPKAEAPKVAAVEVPKKK